MLCSSLTYGRLYTHIPMTSSSKHAVKDNLKQLVIVLICNIIFVVEKHLFCTCNSNSKPIFLQYIRVLNWEKIDLGL